MTLYVSLRWKYTKENWLTLLCQCFSMAEEATAILKFSPLLTNVIKGLYVFYFYGKSIGENGTTKIIFIVVSVQHYRDLPNYHDLQYTSENARNGKRVPIGPETKPLH